MGRSREFANGFHEPGSEIADIEHLAMSQEVAQPLTAAQLACWAAFGAGVAVAHLVAVALLARLG